jgi:hypothetical protein
VSAAAAAASVVSAIDIEQSDAFVFSGASVAGTTVSASFVGASFSQTVLPLAEAFAGAGSQSAPGLFDMASHIDGTNPWMTHMVDQAPLF